ncbi:MAG TPA: hypothetical protein PK777_00165 [Thermoguttaceae bacterium]|nr:hypothetical protein [Thermoguttaceae bacterium]HPP51331.1 hypothetical protein [Thermoguttaceae bacterium]
MSRVSSRFRIAWLVAAVGVLAAACIFLPQAPLHAVATDSNPNCLIATGPVDGAVEAVYVLDALTGDLKAAVVSKRQPGFQAQFARNVLTDFAIEQGKKPSFLMVTGIADIARVPGGVRPASSLVYVVEVNSGVLCAYALPWSPEAHAADKPVAAALLPWGLWKFRTAAVRE